MNTLEVLRKARAKIKQGWCQHASAINADGLAVYADSKVAVAWCSLGSISAVSPNNTEKCRQILLNLIGATSVANWNDDPSRTKRQVLALFDRAIRKLEKRRAPSSR